MGIIVHKPVVTNFSPSFVFRCKNVMLLVAAGTTGAFLSINGRYAEAVIPMSAIEHPSKPRVHTVDITEDGDSKRNIAVSISTTINAHEIANVTGTI